MDLLRLTNISISTKLPTYLLSMLRLRGRREGRDRESVIVRIKVDVAHCQRDVVGCPFKKLKSWLREYDDDVDVCGRPTPHCRLTYA